MKSKTCEKHGEYKARVISILGSKKIYEMCPKCAAEAEAKEKAYKEKEATERINRNLLLADIPQRFLGIGFDSFNTSAFPAKQAASVKKAFQSAIKYYKNFQKARESGSSLIFCGKPGTGKTHLACAILQSIIKQGYTGKYTTAMAAIRKIRDTWSGNAKESHQQAVNGFIVPDLLVLDEVGVQHGTESEQIIIYEIIAGRYDRRLPTILVSNFDKSELIRYIGDRCVDRLEEGDGVTVAFTWGSYRKIGKTIKGGNKHD